VAKKKKGAQGPARKSGAALKGRGPKNKARLSATRRAKSQRARTATGRRTARQPARRARTAALATRSADSITAAVNAVWDQPDNTKISNCAASTPRPNEDCNCFLKNAVRAFFSTAQAFDDATKDADAIVDILADTTNGWTEIPDSDGGGTQRTADAIAAFNSDGKLVIAGMRSGDLGDTHGHLAVVVKGTEMAGSANLEVPRCTAGSVNAAARVKNKGVNWSFGASRPRQVRYFWKVPDASSPQLPRRQRRRPK
jgi:hypothetical protein